MTKPLLFLGSSSAAKAQAKLAASALTSDAVEFLPWWDAFTPGRTLLEELDSIRTRVQGAVLLFSPEIPATVRGQEVLVPNQNVLFEFGYFYGHFGKERVAILRYGDYYLPSDLGGYIHISGGDTFVRSRARKVAPQTVSTFGRWVAAANFQAPANSVTPPGTASLTPEQEAQRAKDAAAFRRRRGYPRPMAV